MARKINIGIVGLGHIGKFHIEAMGGFPEINLVSVCDRRAGFGSLAPRGVAFHVDYRRVLEDRRIETVVIATPNNTHYLLAREALECGKNIILEKPAAECMAELERLEETARSSGLSIYYALHAAHAPDVSWFKSFYAKNSKKWGEPTGFLCRFFDDYVKNGVLLKEAEGLQDCWLDSGINAISVLGEIPGLENLNVESAYAAENHGGKPSFFQCSAEFSFKAGGNERGGLGIVETGWTNGLNHKSTLVQYAKGGVCVLLDHSRQRVFQRSTGGGLEEFADLSGGRERLFNHYRGVFGDYLARFEKGEMNGEDAVFAHKLLFEAENKINESA